MTDTAAPYATTGHVTFSHSTRNGIQFTTAICIHCGDGQLFIGSLGAIRRRLQRDGWHLDCR